MKTNLLLLATLVLFLTSDAVFAQATYKFDGYSIILDAGTDTAHLHNAMNYGGDPVITKIGGGTFTLYDCATSAPLTIPAAPPADPISVYSTYTVPRDGTTGYWCFKGAYPGFKVAVSNVSGGGTLSYTYNNWIATPAATGFYNVKDWGAVGDGTVDDTNAIKTAVAFVATRKGGTLYFPSGEYLVSDDSNDPITLPSGIVLQGATGLSKPLGQSYSDGSPGTKITRIVTKKAGRTIFRIGMATADIKIRNLSLSAESNSGTYGIHAVGSGTESNTTVFVGLDDVTFNGFEIGFKAETIGTGYWQFDHIDLNRTYFLENKVAGILINTPNSDWHISSSQFAVYGSSGVHPDGIVVLTAGMILVENSFAAAITGTGGEFLDVQSCAALTVIGCETEAMTHALQFGDAAGAWGSNSIVITLMNNLFGDGMDIRARSNLISTGNAYFAQNVTTIAGVKIYSTGDRFCGDAAQFTYPCVNGNSSVHTGGFGNGKIMFQTGQQRDPGQDGRYVDGTPMRIGSDVDIQVDDDYAGNAGLSVTSADHTKPLFRLGDRVGNTYSLRRNDDGLLTFSGTQAFPYRGYKFDGQIVPPSFAWAALPTTPGNGAMIYCSDCTRNATPCAGGGSGAPAVKVAGTWECK